MGQAAGGLHGAFWIAKGSRCGRPEGGSRNSAGALFPPSGITSACALGYGPPRSHTRRGKTRCVALSGQSRGARVPRTALSGRLLRKPPLPLNACLSRAQALLGLPRPQPCTAAGRQEARGTLALTREARGRGIRRGGGCEAGFPCLCGATAPPRFPGASWYGPSGAGAQGHFGTLGCTRGYCCGSPPGSVSLSRTTPMGQAAGGLHGAFWIAKGSRCGRPEGGSRNSAGALFPPSGITSACALGYGPPRSHTRRGETRCVALSGQSRGARVPRTALSGRLLRKPPLPLNACLSRAQPLLGLPRPQPCTAAGRQEARGTLALTREARGRGIRRGGGCEAGFPCLCGATAPLCVPGASWYGPSGAGARGHFETRVAPGAIVVAPLRGAFRFRGRRRWGESPVHCRAPSGQPQVRTP